MGREIKFRGKSTETNELVYGSLVQVSILGSLAITNLDDKGHLKVQEIIKGTEGQYTGLKDKNGREIYEGDIVLEDYYSTVNPEDHSDDNYIDDTPRKFVICYDSNQGRYKAVPPETYLINAGNGGWTGYDVRGYKSEVIGNIFEDGGLLNDSENAKTD